MQRTGKQQEPQHDIEQHQLEIDLVDQHLRPVVKAVGEQRAAENHERERDRDDHQPNRIGQLQNFDIDIAKQSLEGDHNGTDFKQSHRQNGSREVLLEFPYPNAEMNC